jgi:cyclic beta-1,2-glucan synthetase
MYRVAVEFILGLKLKGEVLEIDPSIPSQWPKFEATIRHGGSRYEVMVENPSARCKGISQVTLDGVPTTGRIPLTRDERRHYIHVIMGEPAPADNS